MEVITIERAAPADVPFLSECRYGMFQAMHPETDWSGEKDRFVAACRDYLYGHADDPLLYSVCARTASETVGCGIIVFQKRPPHIKNYDNLFGYILNIFVLPEYRRRGVASRIMDALREEAGRRGVQRIGLHASAEGQPVYQRLGYVSKDNYMELDIS